MTPPPKPALDERVIRDACRGEEAAVSRLIECFGPRVERYAQRRMQPRLARHVGPDDIAQESLLAAITSMGPAGVRNCTDFEKYVLAIAERRVRNAGRRCEVAAIETIGLPDHQDGAPEPSAGLASREEQHGFRREMGKLRDDHRWVLVLRDYLGISWETAALALDRPSTHAAQCLYDRARSALGRRIQG